MAAALADPRTGTMAAARGRRLVELPRRTHQHRGPEHLPASRRKPVAARAPAPKPEGLHDVGEDARDHRPLAALATHPPSLASNTFRRQTSKAGAGCLNRARPVLCGGRSVMSVPTAIGRLWAAYKFSSAFPLRPYPQVMNLELTNICNFSCVHCHRGVLNQHRSLGHMEIDLFKKIVAESKGRTREFRLIGLGEPCLHPRFDEFMLILQCAGLKTMYHTNGTLLANLNLKPF